MKKYTLAVLVLVACAVCSFAKSPKPEREYPLNLTVIDTQQFQYYVQYGGGSVTTDCQVILDTIKCRSHETPPSGWPHTMVLVLADGDDGRTYFFGCDAAWRWSHCSGLMVGDKFRARLDNKGLKVEVVDGKGRNREIGYSIFRVTVR